MKAILHCNFCKKPSEDCGLLIVGQNGNANICSECIEICNDIIAKAVGRPHDAEERGSGND